VSNASVYEIVTNKIIEKLENGTVPWRKPWINGGTVNWKTGKSYRGINLWLLDEGEYLTFKQANEAGGKIKQGSKSHIVVFWKMLDVQDRDTDKEKKVPLLRYYRVFNIRDVEGLESKRKELTFDHDPIEEAEKIVQGYINKPTITYERQGAWYKPFFDLLNVPPMKDFENIHEFYSTLFHEMVHSTGHSNRLNREGITELKKFGDEDYSKEELIAEMGASMLAGQTGIFTETMENSASYIQSWLKNLKNDKTLVVQAAQQAQKACDYILGVSYKDNESKKTEILETSNI
jgi:antirestriction protein ArdC